jgi:drug/metabolite transporter (DMT)-like permease
MRDQLPHVDRKFLTLAFMNAVIPYGLIALAELHLSASLAAILNSTTPLFTALLIAGLARERIGRDLALGLVLGLAGVAILVGWSPVPLTGMAVLAIMAMLIASFSYGAAGVYAKRNLGTYSPFSMAVGQQMAATILLLPLGAGSMVVGDSDQDMSSRAVLAVIALGLLCTSFAYLLYFHLLTEVGPIRTSSVTFLIPFFGVFWSWLFLDEQIKVTMLIGLVVILASVRLVNGSPPKVKPLPIPQPATT